MKASIKTNLEQNVIDLLFDPPTKTPCISNKHLLTQYLEGCRLNLMRILPESEKELIWDSMLLEQLLKYCLSCAIEDKRIRLKTMKSYTIAKKPYSDKLLLTIVQAALVEYHQNEEIYKLLGV